VARSNPGSFAFMTAVMALDGTARPITLA